MLFIITLRVYNVVMCHVELGSGAQSGDSGGGSNQWTAPGVGGGVLALMLAALLVFLWIRKKR